MIATGKLTNDKKKIIYSLCCETKRNNKGLELSEVFSELSKRISPKEGMNPKFHKYIIGLERSIKLASENGFPIPIFKQ